MRRVTLVNAQLQLQTDKLFVHVAQQCLQQDICAFFTARRAFFSERMLRYRRKHRPELDVEAVRDIQDVAVVRGQRRLRAGSLRDARHSAAIRSFCKPFGVRITLNHVLPYVSVFFCALGEPVVITRRRL